MLTSEVLSKMKCKVQKTQEETLILELFANSGTMKLAELAEKTQIPIASIRVTVSKSFYLQAISDTVISLKRKGKELDFYKDPFDAPTLNQFVFSELEKDRLAGGTLADYKFRYMSEKVIAWGKKSGFPVNNWLTNQNAYSTQKKNYKKYLKSKGIDV